MSYQEERLQEIANAIREVDGTTDKIPATDFASRIAGLNIVRPSGIKTITENGDYDVKNYAWASVKVEPELRERDILGKWIGESQGETNIFEFKENGNCIILGQEAPYVISNNTIEVSLKLDLPAGTVDLLFVFTYNRETDTLTIVGDDGVETVLTRVPTTLITKEITENGTYKASDDGADGYSEVVVNVAGAGGKPSPFADATPEEIQTIANEISAKGMTSAEVEATYGWKIGDTKDIPLTTGEVIQMRIIGFNHDNLTGGGTAGITLQMVDVLNTSYKLNSTASCSSYTASLFYTTTLPTIKATLPIEWQDIIKLVDKAVNINTNLVSMDLFLISEYELMGSSTVTSKTEGAQYEYWKGKTDNDRIKRQLWWLRSQLSSNRPAFVTTSGTVGTSSGITYNTSYGVSFAFCVGSSPVPVVAGLPIEATTDQEMTNALTQDNLGKVYRFTGTSDTYDNNAIYIIEEI